MELDGSINVNTPEISMVMLLHKIYQNNFMNNLDFIIDI